MDINDEQRDSIGAVVCIRELGDGKSRVILDDVKNKSGTVLGHWEHQIFVTSKDYDSDKLFNLELTEKEFADFGHYILTRILAGKKVLK